MSIKNIYKEVEDKKKNEVENNDVVTMELDEFVEEHQCLVKCLREGTREELLAMADKQEEELEKELEDRGMTEDDFEEEEGD